MVRLVNVMDMVDDSDKFLVRWDDGSESNDWYYVCDTLEEAKETKNDLEEDEEYDFIDIFDVATGSIYC